MCLQAEIKKLGLCGGDELWLFVEEEPWLCGGDELWLCSGKEPWLCGEEELWLCGGGDGDLSGFALYAHPLWGSRMQASQLALSWGPSKCTLSFEVDGIFLRPCP